MARKKSAKTVEQEEFDVDEPSEMEGQQNDGDDSQGEGAAGRRKSARARTVKKPYRGEGTTDDEEEDEEEEADSEDEESEEERPAAKKRGSGAGRGRGGGAGRGRGRGRGRPPAKKQKLDEDAEDSEDLEGEESEGDAADTPPEYRSGCFVVLKADIDNASDNHPIWKIDGKSLLQKYDKVTKGEEVLYKSTTIYAGWSKTVMETYYPIKVEYKKAEGQGSLVKFDPEQMIMVKKECEEKKAAADAAGGEDGDEAMDGEDGEGDHIDEEKNNDEIQIEPKVENDEDAVVDGVTIKEEES